MKQAVPKRQPLAEIIDLLGKKWVMRIIWELRDAPLTFRALQAACDGLSPSVLNNRLKLLEATLILETREPNGYGLTRWGESLLEIQAPLGKWAKRGHTRVNDYENSTE